MKALCHWYSRGDDVNCIVHYCCDSTPVSQAPLRKCHVNVDLLTCQDLCHGSVNMLEMDIWEPLHR